jgi:nicotinamidase-related amidase
MMMTDSILNLHRVAVVSMDLQSAIVSVYAKDQSEFLPRVAGVLQEARSRGVRVIHVQVGFRPGLPEVNPHNKLFGALKSSVQWQQMFQGAAGAIHADVAPQGEEVVITKHRVNAFRGTDLEMILRANQIDTLLLLGIATSGVVLSTLLDASDSDYRLIVVKDCCLDQDSELHACLVEKLFPRRAEMISAADVAGLLSASAS